MRFFSPAVFSLCLASVVTAAPPSPRKDAGVETSESALENEVVPNTVFNSQEVPPIIDMSGVTMKEDISHGYWYNVLPHV